MKITPCMFWNLWLQAFVVHRRKFQLSSFEHKQNFNKKLFSKIFHVFVGTKVMRKLEAPYVTAFPNGLDEYDENNRPGIICFWLAMGTVQANSFTESLEKRNENGLCLYGFFGMQLFRFWILCFSSVLVSFDLEVLLAFKHVSMLNLLSFRHKCSERK